MSRLAVRLALVAIAVALLTVVLSSVLQGIAFERAYRQLPPGLRFSVERARQQPLRPDVGDALLDGVTLPPRLERLLEERFELVRTFTRDFRRSRWRTLVMGALLASLAGAALALLLARRVARPIDAVARSARAVAGGDLNARVPAASLRGADAETRALARDFDAMAAALERSERDRRSLIADVAHEIRTPLAVMRARLAAVRDGVLPSSPDEFGALVRQAEHLTRLVEDLRLLSLAEQGRLGLERRPLEPCALARDVASAFRVRAESAGRALRCTCPAALPPLHADRDRLRQVLGNLLENALRHAASEVRLTVSAHPRGVAFVVADDGPGLPPEVQERVFERFARGERPVDRTGEEGGSGLGLAIVRSLVEAHGGTVSAGSESGGGARFEVVLPVG